MTDDRCVDCGCDTLPAGGPDSGPAEWYMVHDGLWAAAAMAPAGGYLCIGCLETRLERRLTPTDFTDAPVNDPASPTWSWRSLRLISRLTGQPEEVTTTTTR